LEPEKYTVLGLMSGTSLDGVDAAFLETDGKQILSIGPSLELPYSLEERIALQDATKSALRWQFKGASPNSFAHAEQIIHDTHYRAVKAICQANPDWAQRLDMIGFHGQTVLHHPATAKTQGQTLQLGDAKRLALATGKPIYHDFRSNDVAEGGQGAPLAPVYHRALVELAGISGPVALLNLGGVGNVTIVKSDGQIMASDTGPANGPLDSWVESFDAGGFDKGGHIALSGIPDFALIETWLNAPFFQRDLPRSADRYDFDVLADMALMTIDDGAATLAAFTALSVTKTLSELHIMPHTMIVCGGGRHNRAIMWMLTEHVGCDVTPADEYGWNSDAIEAQAFAYLAVRSKLGLPLSFPETTGVQKPVSGGRVAYP